MTRQDTFYDVMEEIYEITRLVHEYESMPRTYGTNDSLYMVEAHTLDLIGRYKKITATEIVELTDRTKGAVSQMVDKLIKKGLAVKHRNPNNFREFLIELTDKGQIVYEYHQSLDQAEYGKHLENMADISEAEFAAFIKVAGRFSKGIKRSLRGQDVRFDTEEELTK